MSKKSAINKTTFLLQALFVVFLWSASRIVIKLGLEEIPPYIFSAMIQLGAVAGLAIYYAANSKKLTYRPTKQELSLMILSGIVAIAAANLFGVIGLQYVSGSMAGLLTVGSLIFSIPFAYMVLRERPRWIQAAGLAVVLFGMYVFMSGDVLSGTLFGIALLLIAEAGYAFSDVLSRAVARRPGDESPMMALVSNVVGLIILLPIGLMVDGAPTQIFSHWQPVAIIVLVGLIFGFSGLLWSSVLNQLHVFEVSLVSNTMLVQVAILSVIFLGEALSVGNVWGMVLVLAGTLIADNRFFIPPAWQMKLGMA